MTRLFGIVLTIVLTASEVFVRQGYASPWRH